MRVTKTIREYIEKEVTARIYPKYAAEEAEAKRRYDARDAFFEKCEAAAQAAFNAAFNENFHEVSDFMKDVRPNSIRSPLSFYYAEAAQIPDERTVDTVYQWHFRMIKEIDETVNEIVAELELGGTKAELMAMLGKVGK